MPQYASVPKRVLLTGAGGFIGSSVATALLARGHQVTAVAGRRSTGRLTEATMGRSGLTVLRGDLADERFALPLDIEVVVHAAATSPAPGISTADMVRDNVAATARLLHYATAIDVESIIYLSSLSIYGDVPVTELDEHTEIRNPEVYGLTKRLCEQMLAALAPPLRAMAIRLPGMLGRGSVRNWLTSVLAAAQAGRDIPVYNCAAPFNNAAHVADLADFIIETIVDDAWGGFAAFPIGAAGSISVGEAVMILIDGAGAGSRLLDLGMRTPCFTISNRAALARGYRPRQIADMLHTFVSENRIDLLKTRAVSPVDIAITDYVIPASHKFLDS
jgi:nucleoside-diphosphate-sugar epimerase